MVEIWSAPENGPARCNAWSRCRTDNVLEFFGVEPPSRRAATHPFLGLLPGSDELVRATRRAPGDLAATLAELELSRLVA